MRQGLGTLTHWLLSKVPRPYGPRRCEPCSPGWGGCQNQRLSRGIDRYCLRGRKPKPTLRRLLEGNRGKRRLNAREPSPRLGIRRYPKYLDDEAKAEWFRTAKVLKEFGLHRQNGIFTITAA